MPATQASPQVAASIAANVARLFAKSPEFLALSEPAQAVKVAQRVRLLLEIRSICM